MLDEIELLSVTYAQEKQELPRCLADCNADGNGNRPSNGRHLRGDDVRLGIDNRYDRRNGSETDRGEQGDELSPPECTHSPTVPEVARALLDQRG